MKKIILSVMCGAIFGFNAMAMDNEPVAMQMDAVVQEQRDVQDNAQPKRVKTRSVTVVNKKTGGPVIHKRPVVRKMFK